MLILYPGEGKGGLYAQSLIMAWVWWAVHVIFQSFVQKRLPYLFFLVEFKHPLYDFFKIRSGLRMLDPPLGRHENLATGFIKRNFKIYVCSSKIAGNRRKKSIKKPSSMRPT